MTEPQDRLAPPEGLAAARAAVALAWRAAPGCMAALILTTAAAAVVPVVHQRLRTYRQGRTSLLISHRLGALRDSDHIVVLANGRITEEGSHEELLVRHGTYARLFSLQASGYRDRDSA
ncbi:hypothetical protein [Streptomyces sparsogenes]|uniref:hypothetical protein n=1 Tax=Streptomyces sparsogenes TaxID=67365 RepID=UPI0033EB8107